jgi:colicin import membrane protein
LLHAGAIVLLLLAPHRLRSAPPTAYTVEIVDPGALGGKLLAGPIGGGAARRAPPPPRAPEPPPPPPPPAPPPAAPEPEVVAKAEPPIPEPPPAKDADTLPLALAGATPHPTTRVDATPRIAATARPVATKRVEPTPRPASTGTPAARAASAAPRHPSPSPVASPHADARKGGARDEPRPTASAKGGEGRGQATPGDLDSQLAAAIKGVESRAGKAGTPGLAGGGAGGGMGGTERSLNGPAGVGGEGPGGGGTLRGLEFVVYYNQMLTRIKESWTYVGERADLRVTVRFSILDNGTITNIQLVERSGDPGYDASVERAVKRASPLEPPPEAYRKDFADVELTFRPADLRRPSG